MYSVLYVDDEPDLLELARIFLEQSEDFHVDTSTSARAALASPRIGSYDAIIADFQMPEMDGIAFLKAIRKAFGNVPFILFTGRGREEIVIEAINHGVDFYLQKGGDVRAQFAELSHKIRQSVARRRAEISLIESEKRLSDIIDFLPDATLAIDREGKVIAWNKAIEEMTGVPAESIIGKGNYEYAIPFYGTRRPILIDLVRLPDDELTRKYYSVVKKEGSVLVAETALPHPRGQSKTLYGTASVLYDREGNVAGAIESIRDITSRKKAEEDLRESERKYRDLFEKSIIGIFRTTPEGKFLTLNTSFARIAGYDSPDEMLNAIRDIRSQLYVDPEDRDRFLSTLAKEGFVKEYEARFYRKDHRPVWISLNASAIRDDRGTILYYEGTIEDITEKKKAQEELAKEKVFSDAVINSIPGLLYLYDSNGSLVRWNKSHETITGYSAEELAGMHVLDWYAGDDKAIATIRAGVKKAFEEGFATAEADLLTKSGKRIPFFFTAQRLEIDGKTYFTGIGIDITERRKAQDELQAAYEQITASEEELREQVEALTKTEHQVRESEENYRALIELAPVAVIVHRQGKILFANPEAIRLTGGHSFAEYEGRDVLEFVHPDYHALAAEHFRLLYNEGKTIPLQEEVLLTLDKKPFTVEITAKPITYQNLPSTLVIFRDVSKRKKAERELQEAYEQLTASNEKLRCQYEELASGQKRIRASEEQLRNVIDFSPFGMHFYELDTDGRLVFTGANPAAATILALDHSRFIGKTIEEAFPGLASTDIPLQYRLVAETGEVWHTDQVIYDRNRIRGAFSVTAFRVRPGAMAAVFFDITEQKRAEAELREKTEELDRYFTTSLDLFCIADTEGYFRRLNPEWEKTLGYTLAELEGHRFLDFVHPEDRQATLEAVSRLTGQEEVLNFTNRYRHRDGSWRWIEWRSRPAGNLIVAAARDITPRKAMEESLRESEEKYRTIFTHIQDVFYRTDTEGNMILASPSILSLFGFASMDEVIGLNAARDLWMYPEQRQDFLDAIRKNGSVKNFEVVLKRRDGTPLTIATSSHFFYDADGRVAGVEGILHDVTGIRAADQQIRLLAGITEMTPASITVHDAQGRFLYANQRTFDLHGWSREEFMERNLHEVDVPVSGELIRERLELVKKNGEVSFDVEHFRKDGSQFPLHVTIKPIRWNDQDAILSIATDMSAQRQVTDALRESEERLQLALQGAELGTWNWNIVTGRVIFSERWADMLGYRLDEIEPHVGSWERLVHPDDLSRVREILDAHLEGKTASYECEHRLHHKNGSWIWVFTKGMVTERDQNGRPLVAAGTHLDITRRKQAEDALRESEAKFRRIADNARDMIYRMSLPDGGYDYVSPASLAITGYTPDELYADPAVLPRLIHPDWIDYFRSQWESLQKGSVPPTYEFQIIDRSGKIHWLNQRNVLVTDHEGRPVALEGIVTDITERKVAEDALRENEQRLRLLTENMVDQIIQIDADQNIISVSPSVERVLSYRPGELIGTSITEHIHSEDIERVYRHTRAAIDQHKPSVRLEYRVRHKNGSYLWFESETRLLYGDDGTFTGAVVASRDISSRKKIEEELRGMEQLYRGLVENSHDVIFTLRPDGIITFVSPSWTLHLGHTQREILGKNFREIIVAEDIRKCEELLERTAVMSEVQPCIEIRVYHRDGSVHWYRATVMPVFDAADRLVSFVGNASDFTEYRNAATALRESEARYRTIIENIQDGFIRADSAGNLIMASPSAARMFGFCGTGDLIGKPITRFYRDPEERQKMLELIRKDGQVSDYETEFVRSDGSVFWGSLNAHFILDETGAIIGTEAVIHEVTMRRNMEQAIREANRKLNLLNTITRHDVANQLTALQGFIQIVSMMKTDPVVRDYLVRIGNVADTITRQIEFTRTYQELGIKLPAWYRIDNMVTATDCVLSVRFSGTCRGIEIFADPMLERVFFNLFDNTVRHGGRATEIHVRCEREPDAIVVIVEDDGIGVPLSEKEKIFSRGYGKHTGLGLFLVREILAITGVSIRETGIPGHGARFEMTVPKGSFRFVRNT